MFFNSFGSKTVRELRKKQSLTAQELAVMAKVSSSIIKKVDHFKFNAVPEPLKSRIEPILRGR